MKIWVMSDLHLEVAPLAAPLQVPDADVCVVAGDLCRDPAAGVRWLEEQVADRMPSIYVAGNHEFYRGAIREGIEAGRAASAASGRVHFLENETWTLGGITFAGATLWTDFRITGHQQLAMLSAGTRMNDYKKISLQRKPWKRFVPEASVRLHSQSKAFLERTLKDAPLPVVVVTHHAPLGSSLASANSGDNAAYVSDLSGLIDEHPPAVWLHGHLHESFDYEHGSTRVICNPRGYENENPAFDPRKVIEL